MVYLLPNHFVICDRVVSTDPNYRKDWLLHVANKPVVSHSTIRVDHGEGRMFCRTLLPTDAKLKLIGGPGKEFWAAGKNWEIERKGLTQENLALMGRWRLEVTPRLPRPDDVFLHAIQVGDRRVTSMDVVERIDGGDTCGAKVKIGRNTWEVTFKTTGDLGGRIRRRGEDPPIDRDLTTSIQPQAGIMAKH